MKNGRIVLSAAALLITAASSFAFKAHSATNSRFHLYTNAVSGCRLSSPALRTVVTGGVTAPVSVYTTAACGTTHKWTGKVTSTN